MERVSTEEVLTSLELLCKQMPRRIEKYIENMGQDSRSASRYLKHKTLFYVPMTVHREQSMKGEKPTRCKN